MKINWGYKIAIVYLGFVALIITLVVVSMNQQVDLVSKDYYAKELAYQARIDKQHNTAALATSVECKVTGEGVLFRIPEEQSGKKITGSIYSYCPSDARSDFTEVLSVDEAGRQLLPLSRYHAGLYKVQIDWSDGEKDFYAEWVIVIP